MLAPQITFNSGSSPYDQIGTINYIKTIEKTGVILPVKEGEQSDDILFRVYNNWALTANIANALNVSIGVYDNQNLDASSIAITQNWVSVYESGYGENSIQPGIYTFYPGQSGIINPLAIGASNEYTILKGSDGSSAAVINAGTNNNGLGFAEITSYVSVPSNANFQTINFAIVLSYEFVS